MATASAPETQDHEDLVMLAVKTPMMPRATTTMLPRRLTVAQAICEVRRTRPRDANATRVVQQLEREMTGTFDYLALNPSGGITKVAPSTTLDSIAVPREVRTPSGPKTVPIVGIEVQSYAPVGSWRPC
jgi:hypothetical protein